MKMNLKRYVGALALAVGVSVGAGSVQAVAAPFQEHDGGHEQDYSKNKNYQQGTRDGKNDFTHNRDHSKKRHFKVDDDQKAYEAGYQSSHHK